MKLLYINTYIPYPLTSGGNQAFFMMADHVRKQHSLSLLLYVHNAKERELVQHLQVLWPDVTFYLYEPQKQQKAEPDAQVSPYAGMSWLDRKSCKFFEYLHGSMERKIARRKHKYAMRIPVAQPQENTQQDFVRANSTLFMGTGDLSPAFCQFVKDVVHQGFDIIQVEFYDYLPLTYLLPPSCKKIFVHHEIRFVRNENEYPLFTHPIATDYLLLNREKAQELAALNTYDAIITLTDIDREILSHYIPAEKIFASPAITQAAQQEKRTFAPASELVFVGSGDHFPNADAMMWFCQYVVPHLRKQLGVVPTIHITGHWRSELQKALSQLCPEVRFEGFVDDLPAFINGKIAIVPIRIGSGMRMKIVDAMFAASPVVTTSKGCEGLPVNNEVHCLIEDAPDAFANAICRLLRDTTLQQEMATQAQNTDSSMLDEETLFNKRLSVYEAITSIN